MIKMTNAKFEVTTCMVCNKNFNRAVKKCRGIIRNVNLRKINSVTCSSKCSRVWGRSCREIISRRNKVNSILPVEG